MKTAIFSEQLLIGKMSGGFPGDCLLFAVEIDIKFTEQLVFM
jgi:hypothetical protein